jgi:hypothetical protein
VFWRILIGKNNDEFRYGNCHKESSYDSW